NGQALVLAVIVAACLVAFAFERAFATALAQAGVFAVTWLLGTYLVTRSLRTVRMLVGALGIAIFSSTAGLILAGAGSFWLDAVMPRRAEMLVMAGLVLAIVAAIESLRERSEELRARVLVIGGGKATQDLLEVLSRKPEQPFRVIGVVDETSFETVAGVSVVGQVAGLRKIIGLHAPDLVVVAAERGRPEIFAGLAESAERGFRVVGLPEFYEHAFARVPIRGMTDAWFMSILHLYQRSYPRLVKRSFDLVVAGLGLLLTAPLFPLIALLARTDGGPIFYRQVRLGEHGQLFTILKFRSMRTDAEQFGAVWAEE